MFHNNYFNRFVLQLQAEYMAVIPEEARGQHLRSEWHKVRDAIIDYSKSAKSTSALSELLSMIKDEFDEGRTFCQVILRSHS
jgi:hypothetical protein